MLCMNTPTELVSRPPWLFGFVDRCSSLSSGMCCDASCSFNHAARCKTASFVTGTFSIHAAEMNTIQVQRAVWHSLPGKRFVRSEASQGEKGPLPCRTSFACFVSRWFWMHMCSSYSVASWLNLGQQPPPTPCPKARVRANRAIQTGPVLGFRLMPGCTACMH